MMVAGRKSRVFVADKRREKVEKNLSLGLLTVIRKYDTLTQEVRIY